MDARPWETPGRVAQKTGGLPNLSRTSGCGPKKVPCTSDWLLDLCTFHQLSHRAEAFLLKGSLGMDFSHLKTTTTASCLSSGSPNTIYSNSIQFSSCFLGKRWELLLWFTELFHPHHEPEVSCFPQLYKGAESPSRLGTCPGALSLWQVEARLQAQCFSHHILYLVLGHTGPAFGVWGPTASLMLIFIHVTDHQLLHCSLPWSLVQWFWPLCKQLKALECMTHLKHRH